MLLKLRLILWKNFLIRKRHWFLSIIEVLIPIILFGLVSYGRARITGLNKHEITEATYQDLYYRDDLYPHVSVGEMRLLYAPYTDFTEYIINQIQEDFQIRDEVIKSFSSPDELMKCFRKNSNNLTVVIIFNGRDTKNLNYDIGIYDKYFRWHTEQLFVPVFHSRYEGPSKYIYKGFAALQVAIDTAFIAMHSDNKDVGNILFSIQEFPFPPHIDDSGFSNLYMHYLPLITSLSFILLCPAVLQRVGQEKQSGAKELMKMVGMKSWMIWFGWLIYALSTNLLSAIAIILLMKISFWGTSYPPIEHSDGTVLFTFLFLYIMAAITFCFLIATVINSPWTATVIGILLWIFSYFVPQAVINLHENLPWIYKIPFAIFPNMALKYGYSAISINEMREIGSQWGNVSEPETNGENDVTLMHVFLMLTFDIFFYMLLSIYIENVKPGEYGVAKPLSFPLLQIKSWFTCRKRKIETDEQISLNQNCDKNDVYVKIKGLYKRYYSNVALDNLSMKIFSKRITVLLGHNGAGKTTLMSLLTGMIDATEGTIEVNGRNMKTETDDVRMKMGLCSQHNLLFPDLTVKEHLIFFAMLRGLSYCQAKKEVKDFLNRFNIHENKHSMINTLSGGMKRKVCLGMAFIGKPELIVLDEPTSGMDFESRREIWNLLKEYRKSKTILITTHLMEEADVLGDHVAILANGRLQCYGTPTELKKKYKTGYHLLLTSPKLSYHVGETIEKIIPRANLVEQNGTNVKYALPLDQKPKFAKLFETLEKSKHEWGIVNMDLQISTLNDVLLKSIDDTDDKEIVKLAIEDNVIEGLKEKLKLIDNEGQVAQKNTKIKGFNHEMHVFYDLFWRRLCFLKRNFTWYIPAAIVTISVCILTLWLQMSNNDYSTFSSPKLNLNLDIYGKSRVYYGGENSPNTMKMKMKYKYEELVLKQGSSLVQWEDVSQGILEAGIENIAFYKTHMIVGAEFNFSKKYNEIMVNAMYSSNALHSIPISINLAMNAIAKTTLNESYSITTGNLPLKPLFADFSPSELSPIGVGLLWTTLMSFGIFIWTSNCLIFPNLELSTNFTQIRFIGDLRASYWMTHIIFDICFTCLPLIFLTCASAKLVDWLIYNSILLESKEIGSIAAILFCCTVGSLPFTYVFAHRKTLTGGLTAFIITGVFLGIVPTVIIQAMEMSKEISYLEIAKWSNFILACIFPQFSLSHIFLQFSQKYVENFNWKHMQPSKRTFICETEPTPCCRGATAECHTYECYFSNEKFGIKWTILQMVIPFTIWIITLLFIKKTRKLKDLLNFHNKNEEVNSKCTLITLETDKLTKSFGKNKVVNELDLKLESKKCFGLLGVNGAGKSTTFQLLIRSLRFDKGKISIQNFPIGTKKYFQNIGYCPQENCLNYFLTGREIIQSMATIRGYSNELARDVTQSLLEYLDLEKIADKPCVEYSGGNKRKINFSIALLGLPSVVLLDEPTNGIDPANRRKLWSIMAHLRKTTRASYLLSSHSTEECENLCDEIGIMGNGAILQQGTVTELKNKYEHGYKIQVNLSSEGQRSIETLKKEIAESINAELDDECLGVLVYQMKNREKSLDVLFSYMEHLSQQRKVDDYIITQILLEDVLNKLSNNTDHV